MSAFVDVDFRCDGNEMSDYVGEILANTNYQTEMQFYLDNQACIIKYIKDDYVNDDEGPVVLTATIPKGTTQTIRLLRESINLTNNNNSSTQNQSLIVGHPSTRDTNNSINQRLNIGLA